MENKKALWATAAAVILLLLLAAATTLLGPAIDMPSRFTGNTIVGITPVPPGHYVPWAWGTVVPPTRQPSDPLYPGNQIVGIDVHAATLAQMWGTAPTGCTEASCTTSNINWTMHDTLMNAQDDHTVKLADGTTRTSPMTINIPPQILNEHVGTCGTAATPCAEVTIPEWMKGAGYDCRFVFEVKDGVYYEGFRFDLPICKNRLKQLITEAATRYGDDTRIVGARINVGFQGESAPTKIEGSDTRVTQLELITAHEKTVSCDEYTDYIVEISEHAYTQWSVNKHKPIFVLAGPGPCAGGGWNKGYALRGFLENDPDKGGWNVPGNEKYIGYSLNRNWTDANDADAPPGTTYGAAYDRSWYQWFRFGDYTLGKDVGLTYETAFNPNGNAALSDNDEWAYQVWEWYTMAGVHADYAGNNYLWHPLRYTELMWEVNTYLLGLSWPYRGWIVFRDAEWTTHTWNSGTYAASGYRGTWRNWLDLPNYATYTQACNSNLQSQVAADYAAHSGNTMLHVPCESALPTPAVTPRPTVTPGDMVDEMNRTFNRQALVLGTSGAASEMDITIDTTHPNYATGITTNVTVTLAYLDAGTDKIYTLLPTTGGTITNTLTKTGTGQWKRHTFTQANVTMGNTLTGVNNDAFVIIKNDGVRSEYLHELWVDRVPGGGAIPTQTPTPTFTPSPTPTYTPSPTPTRTPTATPSYTTGVRINEISPTNAFDWNLSGDITEADRWFELINWSASPVNVNGYSISNGAATYTIPNQGFVLLPYGHYVFFAEDTVTLPASGTLTLRNTSNTIVSQITYGAQTAGTCYAAVPNGSDSWASDQPCTPGY